MLSIKETDMLIQLICEKQIAMINSHGNIADGEYINEYFDLEILKIKVKKIKKKLKKRLKKNAKICENQEN